MCWTWGGGGVLLGWVLIFAAITVHSSKKHLHGLHNNPARGTTVKMLTSSAEHAIGEA